MAIPVDVSDARTQKFCRAVPSHAHPLLTVQNPEPFPRFYSNPYMIFFGRPHEESYVIFLRAFTTNKRTQVIPCGLHGLHAFPQHCGIRQHFRRFNAATFAQDFAHKFPACV